MPRSLTIEQIETAAALLVGTDDDAEIAISQLGIDPDEVRQPYRGLYVIGGITRCVDCGEWRKKRTQCGCSRSSA